MRCHARWFLPLFVMAFGLPGASAQGTAPGTPDFVDASTQALIDMANAKSGKDAAIALLRLSDRLMISIQEKVQAGKSEEAAAIAEAYRVTMREGLANMGADKSLQTREKAALQSKEQAEKSASKTGDGDGQKLQVRTQEQDRLREQDRTQTKGEGQDPVEDPLKAQVKDQVRDQSRVQDKTALKSGADEDVMALVATATSRHAHALRNAMAFASPEAKRALEMALEACTEVRLSFGLSAGPGPKAGEPGIPNGPKAGNGQRMGAPSEPPRVPQEVITRPAPQPRRSAP